MRPWKDNTRFVNLLPSNQSDLTILLHNNCTFTAWTTKNTIQIIQMPRCLWLISREYIQSIRVTNDKEFGKQRHLDNPHFFVSRCMYVGGLYVYACKRDLICGLLDLRHTERHTHTSSYRRTLDSAGISSSNIALEFRYQPRRWLLNQRGRINKQCRSTRCSKRWSSSSLAAIHSTSSK